MIKCSQEKERKGTSLSKDAHTLPKKVKFLTVLVSTKSFDQCRIPSFSTLSIETESVSLNYFLRLNCRNRDDFLEYVFRFTVRRSFKNQ